MRWQHRNIVKGSPVKRPIILYQMYDSNPLFQYRAFWMSGNDATPVSIPGTFVSGGTPAALMSEGVLSPSRREAIYIWRDNQSPYPYPATRLYRIPVPDGTVLNQTVIAASPDASTGSPGAMYHALFSPDGNRVYYTREDTAGFAEVRKVNYDGSGDTLVYARKTGSDPLYRVDIGPPFLAYDESQLAHIEVTRQEPFGTSLPGVWVVGTNGASPTRIVQPYSFDAFGTPNESYDIICVGRTEKVIYFRETHEDASNPPYRVNWEKINFDGSGRTVLYTYTYGPGGGTPVIPVVSLYYPLLPDDSALMVRYPTYGTEPKYVISYMSTSTGAITPMSPERRMAGSAYASAGPVVFYDRIYFTIDNYPSLASGIASVALDGSDYKVDHNFGSSTLTFQGFYSSQ